MAETNINPLDNIIDFREFLFKLINNWFYFLLSILLALLIAFGYTRYSKEYYRVFTKVYINNDNDKSSAADVLYNSITESKASLKDEVNIFTSYPLVFQTVSDLRFDISYDLEGNIKTTESFHAPIKVLCSSEVIQNNPNISFSVDVLDDTTFRLYCKKYSFENVYLFGEEVELEGFNFIIERDNTVKFDKIPTTIVRFNKLKQVAKEYQRKIQIEKLEKESNIITLYILEEDQTKGIVFLNTLVNNFIDNQIETKKKSSLNTVSFIQEKINSIEDSLSLIEIKLQEYKNSHQIPDINLKTQNLYKNISELESELSTYKYQDKYYSYLEEYINNGNGLERVVAPSTYGITNSSLSDLIKQLVSIQLEKNVLIDGGQINNPSVKDFDLQLNQLSINIKEVILNSKKSNSTIIKDLKERITIEESSLSFLPIEQRELLNIERIQKTSEGLYMFLLQKKSEAEITASSITSNVRHIEPAAFFNKKSVLPNVYQVYSISLLIGVLFPLLFLLILDVINDKIKSRIDLERLTKINLIGLIGRNHSAHNLLLRLNPKSAIAEGFRALRSNLVYQDKDLNDKVYLVTSSLSGEGKTFIASNLAVVFANSGKKTLLLGADMRRPKIYEDFSTENIKGLSSLLEGIHSIDDVTIHSEEKNLDVIISGPPPENPSDILLSDNFESVINTLKEKYDKIIIDTAPVGLVADAYMVMKYTDVNLYIIRQNYTGKEVLRFVNGLHKSQRIENLHLILNDVSSGSGVYGYGKYSYGYSYGHNYGNKYGYYTKDTKYFEED
ncbi:MAG: hypothetical protein CMD22_01905 [Flavobacteriales bacterium]|nr:hypothetical protein [Flavobacteriales bacterium]